MPRPRLHSNHAARQAAYRTRQKEKDLQPLALPVPAAPLPVVPPVPCPSPTCPFQLSGDAPSARSAVRQVSGDAPTRTLFQIYEERALRLAVDDLLDIAQTRGLLDEKRAHETQVTRLYQVAKELWKQKPKP